MVGPVIFIVCAFIFVEGCAAPIVSYVRHGKRGLARALLGVPGGLLIFGWFVVYVGMAEGVYTIRHAAVWLEFLIGVLGATMVWFATRQAFRARPKPGHCDGCGYDAQGLARCPECGRVVSPSPAA